MKKLHLSKNERLVDITPLVPGSSSKYKIVLNRKLYNDLINSSITIKYFDKQYIYEIKKKNLKSMCNGRQYEKNIDNNF